MLVETQRQEALMHFQRGVVLERAHRVHEAVEEYRRAIERYPHLREAHDALGFYYQRYGLLAKAAEEFRLVANLEGDFLSHFNLGYVLLELGQYDEAQAAFQRCLVFIPDDPATHYELACLRFMQGEYQRALEYLQVPLRQYSQDWEVYNLVGRCKLRQGMYDEALVAFLDALRLAHDPVDQAEISERIAMVERYRETGAPHWAKDRMYADFGVAYLGSAQDDGIQLREAAEYHFTYPDIGMTLRRMIALCDQSGWRFTCVVGLDRLAQPLAAALSTLLGIPQCNPEGVGPNELPLLVMAIGREAELLAIASERIPSQAVTFCLGLNWMRHSAMLPDITGVIVRGACSVPWESELRRLRSDRAPASQIAECLQRAASQLVAAATDVPMDSNLARQVRYYTHRHQRLRFADLFVAPPAA